MRILRSKRSTVGVRIALGLMCTGLVASGCGQPKADLYDPAAVAPIEPATKYDDQPWGNTLRMCVRDGLVDYSVLKRSPEQLDQFIEQIAFVGPTTTPALFKDRASRLAYAINCYNACVLKAVLAAEIPSTMHDVAVRDLGFDYRYRVDGKIVNLDQIRAVAVAESEGNARVFFALSSGAKGSPPLSDQPYRAEGIDTRLQDLARQAMGNPRMVMVNHEKQQLLVGLDIWSNREAFFAMFRKETRNTTATMLNCLMHLSGGQRRQFLARAVGYHINLVPFDRALNAWSPSAGG